MATFGNTSGTGDLLGGDQNGTSAGSAFVLSEAGAVSKLTAIISNVDAGHATCNMKGFIYADAAGVAGALIAATNGTAVADNFGKAAKDLVFASPVNLAAGTYWLIVNGDADAAGCGIWIDTGGTLAYCMSDDYAAPNNPYVTDDTIGYTACIYATYAPAAVSYMTTKRGMW